MGLGKKEAFGTRLRKLREELGLSMAELAFRADLHPSTISRLESDMYRHPHMDTFIQLARGFGISLQELAVLTNLIEPETCHEGMVVMDSDIVSNYHLLTKDNLALLKVLEDVEPGTKYYLIQLVTSLQHGREGCQDGSRKGYLARIERYLRD